jgi:chromosome segregation protein
VYVKRVELTNFKSFGGTTPIPLLPGFTVISGPNGSGKSNLLDALLFCLGLAGSKGMRAERLPDLVNHSQATRGRSTVEAAVTATFDLSDELDVLAKLNNPDSDEEHLLDASSRATLPPEPPSNGNGPRENGAVTNGNGQNGHGSNGHGEPGNGAQINTEWSVTRKLRVTQQGTYTSNYFINGEPCTLTELHDQLNRLRIYPEGYNVVLQGDVTRIISMNSRERREIIDELAGVATFDRKINQAKEKLDAVKDREDRYHIVEKELIDQRDRLAQDRIKAEKYKKLRAELQTKAQWEVVIRYQQAAKGAEKLQQQIKTGEQEITDLAEQLTLVMAEIGLKSSELEQLNARVRALGEAEQIALQSTLATHEAELRQLQRQAQDLQTAHQTMTANLTKAQQDLQEQTRTLASLTETHQIAEQRDRATAKQHRDAAQNKLEEQREIANASAASAEAWVQEQTNLHHSIDTLLKQLEPQKTQQAQLQERTSQLEQKIQEQGETLAILEVELATKQAEQIEVDTSHSALQIQVQTLAQTLAEAEQAVKVQQETQSRLLNEQRDKQRQIDKLEAQTQAMQEAQGTQATKIILEMKLKGVCGLVAQLGKVDPRFQLALETAAGGRLGNLVVEDDAIAAAAIDILKQKRGGRATFLPLNKIQSGRIPNSNNLRNLRGCIDYAFNLIEFEARYREIFAYVFGSTVVFETVNDARQHLGQFRMVTLEGELLESSGAMTGGSQNQRSTLKFGTVDPGETAEARELRDRLEEIDRILLRCQAALAKAIATAETSSKALIELRQQHKAAELTAKQLRETIQKLQTQRQQLQPQLHQNTQELATAQARLETLDATIPAQEVQLQAWRTSLAELEQSHAHSGWQQIQAELRAQEATLNEKELALRTIEQRLLDLTSQIQRTEEKITQGQTRIQEYRTLQTTQLQQQSEIAQQQQGIQAKVAEVQAALVELEKTLGAEREQRDRVDRQLRDLQTRQQQVEWQRDKNQETQATRRTELATLQEQVAAQAAELPDPLPEIPETATRDVVELQHELRSLQKRLQAMEPVNMLALEEYDRTQTRLEELTEKLTTLQEERTELLLRIENFTTLRQQAFKEAYDAVDINFQSIFATLSDGDGRLQLEDPTDPFNGGLNLIAHPKGKPVQRLASMSGGEKSLTALSFIFALQRYRPSPFYAFDEVDMFLDGANVERLARMIKQQAQQAQFIVVSLRRPMIESAQRTIGVTQARGAYTQVIGIKLEQQSASGAAV